MEEPWKMFLPESSASTDAAKVQPAKVGVNPLIPSVIAGNLMPSISTVDASLEAISNGEHPSLDARRLSFASALTKGAKALAGMVVVMVVLVARASYPSF